MLVNNVRFALKLCSSLSSTSYPLAPRVVGRCNYTQWINGGSAPRLLAPRNPRSILFRGSTGRSRTRLIPELDSGGPSGSNGIYYSRLTRPFLFTVGFGCCSFAGAAIWQYENFRKFAKSSWMRQPSGWIQNPWDQRQGFRSPKQMFSQWWNGLTEGQRVALGIICLNGLVFVAWRVPAAKPYMVKWFASNPAAKAICWPMVLSTFSHYTFWHFGVNMYVLYSFSTGIVAALGKEQFVALYLSAGVVSSFASYLHKVVTVRPGLSLGASGCLMGVLGFFCTQFPTAKLAIIFLPMFTFTADMALKGVLIMDGLGVLLGWKVFDHAAHLGGALFGIFYAKWGREYIWSKREPLVRMWNQIRGKP